MTNPIISTKVNHYANGKSEVIYTLADGTVTLYPENHQHTPKKEVTKGATSGTTVNYMTKKGWHIFDSAINKILFWKR